MARPMLGQKQKMRSSEADMDAAGCTVILGRRNSHP
jgi:hypothetical protein